MPHLHRFYVPTESLIAGRVSLPPDAAHHAFRVARVREGDRVALFDGQGREARGQVVLSGGKEVVVSVETVEEIPRPMRRVSLGQAWLNREKNIEGIVTRGVELGVCRFVFFRGDRSERAPRHSEKWQRLAIEACKQTGRPWLPEFELAPDLSAAIGTSTGAVLIATKQRAAVSIEAAVAEQENVLLLVGPEGDFSEAEMDDAIGAGAVPISLGEYTLRSEVAVSVGLTLVQRHLGNL